MDASICAHLRAEFRLHEDKASRLLVAAPAY